MPFPRLADLQSLPIRPEDIVPQRINRAPSPLLASGLPWLSVMVTSLAAFSPVIASAPVVPPLAFMVFLSWRMLRPSLLPLWAGLPLGAFDDLYSGQPFGSGVVLWSAAMLAMDAIDNRILWRSFEQDWAVASLLMTLYLVLAAAIAGLAAGYPLPLVIGPQLLVTLALYPLVTRAIALLDRIRLLPLRSV
ncbi:rod shape-determining protein MreD [Novosphingobium fuchskuhlense]|uniref:Rod shape-determining protein MreD n=1 Tax=Novosphingobium fuchskuhlense TaxID=1117702 RepID=A0A117UUB9_9SPHN|nr:rod shape-determining protein MreD [Novosphingobium fuchskuhlense]KUR71021.1 rod shape-determining protein MreD [Novosphingobium fuchskuhlense]